MREGIVAKVVKIWLYKYHFSRFNLQLVTDCYKLILHKSFIIRTLAEERVVKKVVEVINLSNMCYI